MADNIFAAASTTGAGSSERIAGEFMSQGAPSNPANVAEGSCLGGYEVMTPRVGTGFIEWAVSGYNLEGKAPAAITTPDYDRHGDWTFDKKILPVSGPVQHDDENYRDGKSHGQKKG